jgi:excisionase family DNA binding protein
MQKKQYYSIKEVAEYFDVSPDLIRKLIDEGKVPGARRLGNIWRIPASFLEDNQAIDEGGSQPDKPDKQ